MSSQAQQVLHMSKIFFSLWRTCAICTKKRETFLPEFSIQFYASSSEARMVGMIVQSNEREMGMKREREEEVRGRARGRGSQRQPVRLS